MSEGYYNLIMEELRRTLGEISAKITEQMVDYISGAPGIFITGKGRTGLIMKTFAIRLMQMGFTLHVLDEASTPAVKAGDLLLIGSGSGETESLLAIAGKAKKIGAKIALITMNSKSTIAGKADLVLVIPAKGSKYDEKTASNSIQPMCNLFEQSLLLFLDSLSMLIMDKNKIDIKILYERHANLE